MIIWVSNTTAGFGILMGAVIIAVIVYTIIKLRKQAGRAEEKEEKKNKHL